MFFPARMTKVRVICPKRSVDAAVDGLYAFGMIHITPTKTFSASAPLASFRFFSEKLVLLRSIASALELPSGRPEELTESRLLERWQEAAVDEVTSWLKQKAELEVQLKELVEGENRLLPFRHLSIPASLLFSPRVNAIYFEPLSSSASLPKGVEHVEVQDGKRRFTLVVFDARRTDVAQKVAEQAKEIFEIPRVDNFEKAYEQLVIKKANLEASLKAVNTLLSRFLQRKGKLVSDLLASVELAAKKAELPAHFGESKVLSAVEGWIPSDSLNNLERHLAKCLEERVLVETLDTHETPPTKLENPRLIQPFEFLVKALSLPKYEELDPTLLVFLSFPLFFGMILGDIGYGLLMVFLGLALRAKFSRGFFRTIGNMMLLSAFWTIVFGYIFGEFFGLEHVFGYELHPLIHRAEGEGLLHLMQLSLLFGFIHLGLGYTLGAFVAYKEHHRKHALAKFSWLLMLVSIVSYLSAVAHIEALDVFNPLASLLGSSWIWMIGLAFIGLFYTEGANALFELPGLLGNVVSYLRIMALGVSGVVLVGMVNQIPLRFSPDPLGLISFVVLALFFILGQAFALALGIFESSIQSLRLHYVEFFSKFYHGGGIPFTPLKEKLSVR